MAGFDRQHGSSKELKVIKFNLNYSTLLNFGDIFDLKWDCLPIAILTVNFHIPLVIMLLN